MTPPETPTGYRQPTRFHYSSLLLGVLSAIVFAASAIGFGGLLWFFQGKPEELTISISISSGRDFLPLFAGLGVFVGTLVVHEAIHGFVFRRLGYRVSYGFEPRIPALYTVAFGQFVTRRDNMLVDVAPLAAMTLVGIPLLAGPMPIALAAYFALLVNTSGAVGDLYLLWRLWRMPSETVLYDTDFRHSYVFEPTNDTAIGVGKP
ncbi:Putative zincin peptidase [Haladaptatus litoreus]|uniref:Putative zincin peptidase n=1 Tax=Haladaptatus litoreus TaxID=553468 RepID=A0A1N7BGI4_9EURY|nr:DUF3267 domain-containing protein [Haladaptatus litoreus]SIR50412.1 Putative zincin peptidase [Haladaptatus litoreus]